MEPTKTIFYDELVERCKQGDTRCYAVLYNQYAKAMYNTSLRIVNNVPDAEDVLQESFAEAFRHLKDFNYASTFGAWLKKIIVNRSLNMLRRQNAICIDDLDFEQTTEEFVDEAELQLKVDKIKKAIGQLPGGYRAVLTLHLFEGYDYDEIGEIMKITPTTARTQYYRAKGRLLNILIKEVCCEK